MKPNPPPRRARDEQRGSRRTERHVPCIPLKPGEDTLTPEMIGADLGFRAETIRTNLIHSGILPVLPGFKRRYYVPRHAYEAYKAHPIALRPKAPREKQGPETDG